MIYRSLTCESFRFVNRVSVAGDHSAASQAALQRRLSVWARELFRRDLRVAHDAIDRFHLCPAVGRCGNRRTAELSQTIRNSDDAMTQTLVAEINPDKLVEALIERALAMPWEPAKTVGEGDEYRADSPQGDHASALVLDESVVHGSVVAAV
jgi:hypothetical protein